MFAKGDFRMKAIIIAMAICLLSTASWSQGIVWPTECEKPTGSSSDELKEYTECLDDRIEQLKDSQNLLLNSILDLHDKFAAAMAELKLELDGPNRIVELIPAAKEAITHGYWAGGTQVRSFNCVTPASPKSGFTIFGAQLSAKFRFNNSNWKAVGASSFRGCAPAPFCDSAGEFCENQSRAAGCYVNNVWFEWKKRRVARDKSPLNYNTVCKG